MFNILISGCSGFLAQHLCGRLLRQDGRSLHGITEVSDYSHPTMAVHRVDLRDADAVRRTVRAIKPAWTFHLAAISNVAFAWKNQALTYEVNIIGSANLLEALAAESPSSRVILMSSGEIYRHVPGRANPEDAPLSPTNPYALSKWAMEMLAAFYPPGRLQIMTIRGFNFTGPGQDRKFVTSDFAAQIAEIEKGRRKPPLRVGNLAAVRDFSDVRDIARYLETIAERGDPGEVYNLCSGKRFAVADILKRLLSLASVPIEVIQDPEKFRPVDMPEVAGDCRLIQSRFGLFPEIPMERTLLDLLNDWRERIP